MAHRGLSNERKRVDLRHIVTPHDLQNGGEHDTPEPDPVFQLFDVGGFINLPLR